MSKCKLSRTAPQGFVKSGLTPYLEGLIVCLWSNWLVVFINITEA